MKPKLSRRDFLKMTAAASAALMSGVDLARARHRLPGALPGSLLQDACVQDWTPTFPPIPRYDPPVRISVPFSADTRYPDGDDATNNPMYNRIVEQLGVEYTPKFTASGDVRTRLNIAAASGELPDMFWNTGIDTANFVDNGVAKEITDIWNATATDLVKEKKGYPDAEFWRDVRRGDRIYGIPFIGPAHNIENFGHIRADLLDQLGMDPPDTLEDLDTILHAFKSEGFCEYPLALCQALASWATSADPIFGAFGVMPIGWVETSDGDLMHASLDRRIKEPLALLRDWYADGLIDPDFFTYGETTGVPQISSGRAGVIFSPWWYGGGIMEDLLLQLPSEARFTFFGPPAGPDGTRGFYGYSMARGGNVLFRHGLGDHQVEAAIQHLNWAMDLHVNWREYQQYGEWRNSQAFAEGYYWQWDEDCNVVPGPLFPEGEYRMMHDIGFTFPWVNYPAYQIDVFADMADMFEEYDADPSGMNKAEIFLSTNEVIRREVTYYNFIVSQAEYAIFDKWSGTTTDNFVRYQTNLDVLRQRTMAEVIIGARSVGSYDDYIDEWLASGGREITRDVNAWWHSR